MNWTQEQRDELIALWDNGNRSYSEIARILGLSKNAVVGRMRREKKIRGLPVEDQFAHRSKFTKPKKFNPYPPKQRAKRMENVLPEFVLDETRLASIIDVTGCKWPVKDDPEMVGGIACCNHDTEEGQSYCPYHQQINVASYSRKLIRKTAHSALKIYLKNYKRAA